ncbi:MAG: HAMP domain-containing histidine kinase, partial [Actinomycetota bacterium]|nr:HAMP domain-containing histidine kinase [Actinomycetota bacterium]
LFALGAWLAGRIYLHSAEPVYMWLSLALLVQVFTQVHEILHPAFLGPIVTSADVLRSQAFLLLLVGALLQIRRIYRDRSQAVRDQQADLRVHEVLAGELTRFAEQEQVFRAIVSHELATPIATIRAFAHVLDTALPPDPGRIRQAVAGIGAESRRLTELVARMDELRDLELAEFRCDLRSIRIQPLLEDAATFAKGLPGDHPITLRCSDARVDADPVRLGQAVRNVLTNAARYAPTTTPILIEGTIRDRDRYQISVSDHGPGVPRDERKRVLRRYARGSSGRATEGGGLGLYLASRIIDAHHGKLWIEDAGGPNSGARVVIELRLAT